MLNTVMNQAMKMLANKTLKTYRSYPSSRSALVLVDVQNEFLQADNSGWQSVAKVADGVGFKQNMSSLIKFSRAQGMHIIYVPYTDNILPVFETPAHQLMKKHIQAKGEFAQASRSTELDMSILPGATDTVVTDRTGLSAFSGSGLHQHLQDESIEHLVFAGPLINIGLDSSVRDAVEFGYHATLITDCAAATSKIEYDMAAKVTFPRFCQTLLSNKDFQTEVLKLA